MLDKKKLKNLKLIVFDLDGTLTVAIHDFESIKRTLDLPTDKPILESLIVNIYSGNSF